MGIYGLTQACLQIPFGMLSDRVGRKPMITLGLILFILGSIIAATADSVWGMIIGRALQGAGAIGGVVIALLADLTREEERSKAMALIGMVIGMAFVIAIVTGPLLNNWMGMSGIFWLSAALAVVAMALLYSVVPNPARSLFHRDAEAEVSQLSAVLSNPELLRLNGGILILHAMLTASFVIIPVALQNQAGLPQSQQWQFYLPILLLACVVMLPLLILGEKKQRLKPLFLLAIGGLIVAQLEWVFFGYTLWGIALGLFIFMTAFTLLEATLPSMISRVAPANSKGTAMGVYSSAQFLGIFLGGMFAGWLYGHQYFIPVFLVNAAIGFLWFFIAKGMKPPAQLTVLMLNVGVMSEAEALAVSLRLRAMTGVVEAEVMADDGIAYLKIDKNANKEDLHKFSVT
jgi:MFS family permease